MNISDFKKSAINAANTTKASRCVGLITFGFILFLYGILKIFINNGVNFFLFTVLFGCPIICLFLTTIINPKKLFTAFDFLHEILIGCQLSYSIILFFALYSWTTNPHIGVLEPIFVSCATALTASILCIRSLNQKMSIFQSMTNKSSKKDVENDASS